MIEVSLLLVARDEERCIAAVLTQALGQDLPRERYEILVVIDPASRDRTGAIATAVLAACGGPDDRVLVAPRPSLAAGWNAGIVAARGARIVRWDVHGEYPRTYLSRALAAAQVHAADVVGGPCRPSLPDPQARGFWARCILAAECSPLVAISAFRRDSPQPRRVATVARGLYDRRVFERIGLLRELPYACEDAELHARARAAGLRFVLDPSIASSHHVRTDVASLDRQKWRNGAAVGWIAVRVRSGVRPLHMAPALAVAVLAAGAIAAPMVLLAAIVLHGLVALASLVPDRRPHDLPTLLGAAALVVGMHWIYGVATWWGVVTAWRPATAAGFLPHRGAP